MVAKGSPDWLPSGWTVEYKVQKTGRKIRLYKNVESGKSFYYKDDVIGYIKSIQSQKSQPTSSRIKTQSENSPVQLTVITNEHPEWLPVGWKVESRTRLSGSNAGGVYKCYIDPATDSKFYSKPEVFRYLRTVKNKVCTLKERKTSKDTKSRSQVVIERYKDEDLPPGWIKEIKIKGIRKDTFYIDPKSGYIFRSKKEVLRYLETGEISKHAFKPKEGGNNDRELVNDKVSRPSTTKGRKLEHSAATPQPLADAVGKEMPTESCSELPGDQIPQSGSKLRDASVPPVEKTPTESSSELPGDQIPQSGSELGDASVPPVEKTPTESSSELPGDQIPQSGSELRDASVPPVEKTPTESSLELPGDQIPQSGSELRDASVPPVEKTPTESSSDLPGDQIPLSGSELRDASVSPIETGQELVSLREGVKESYEIKEKCFKRSASPKADPPECKETERVSSDNVPVSTSASESDQEKALPKSEKLESNKMDAVTPENTPPSTTESKLEQEKTAIFDMMEIDVPVSTSAFESDQEKALPNSEKLESNKMDVVTPGNTPLSTTESKLEQEKTAIFDTMEIGDNGEKIEMKQVDNGEKTKTRRSRSKKEDINLPRRSSKRLAGLNPELVPKAEANKVLQASSNRISFTEVSPDAGLTVNTDADKAGQQLNVTKPERDNDEDHVSNLKDIPLHENPSNKRKTPLECSLDVPEEKIQKVQTEKKDDGKMETQLSVPIAEFWSDPCLEFAIKTLTGALPVENATITNEPVSNPTFDFLQGQNSVNNGLGSMNKRTQGNKKVKNKKQPTSNRRSPSINGLKPELASNIISFQQAKHHSNEAVLGLHLADGGILGHPQSNYEQCKTPFQILPDRELHHPSPDVNSERSNMTNTCHENNKMVLDDQPQNLQTKDYMTSETPLSFPFADSWADPCLDFAFKTLTGAIPIEDNLEIQSFFEERIESSRSHKDSSISLPDFGSPNFFQNDISSHFDGPEKSVSGQHLGGLDPQLSVGNASVPSCSGFSSQQVDRNRYFKGR